MKKTINERINELETYVLGLRTMIKVTNNEILVKGFVPNKLQELQLEHLASQGRKALKDINILRKQINQL
ncbi:hypothetical protein [Lacinutrix chionoecetis]